MLQTFKTLTLQTLLCSLLLLQLAGCEEENRLDIDVSNVDVTVDLERIDQQWFELTPVSYRAKHPQWLNQFPDLYPRYIEDILGFGGAEDTNLFSQIRRFTTDRSISEVNGELQSLYPDLDFLQEDLTQAWKYYQFYFPNRHIPKHMIFMGGFNTPVAVTDDAIGIGLEMYMGSNSVYYEFLQIPLFIRQRMTKDHIAPTALKGWVESEFILNEENPTLLDRIVHEGKILYALDAIFPSTDDSLKIFYSKGGMEWAEAHEEFVWAHFIDEEFLFETNTTLIGKYTNDGPFTVDLAKESPSRMGIYIGWQIVRAYMENQETINLEKLMATDAEEILNKSKYKP